MTLNEILNLATEAKARSKKATAEPPPEMKYASVEHTKWLVQRENERHVSWSTDVPQLADAVILLAKALEMACDRLFAETFQWCMRVDDEKVKDTRKSSYWLEKAQKELQK